jgi:Asp-tRNA(Asn)/Glu-tRNA(Gln) amidotransferase A subunit family amidase
MKNDPIFRLSATELADKVRKRELSPREILGVFLDRIADVNPAINAFCTIAAEQAQAQAKEAEASVMKRRKLGPLHGVPVSIKDSVFTKGIRSTIGSRLYADFVPKKDAVVVERLKKAGAIILGKTNTPEFCLMATTDNLLFGVTRNPWNTDYTPGGSSGGAAAATAACLSPISIGSDGGGSIRVPGSFCGVFGLKPSHGRVPQYPNFPGWDTTGIITTGPLTRTVEDAALALQVIAGVHSRDRDSLPGKPPDFLSTLNSGVKALKIAWSADLGYAKVDPQVLRITEKAAAVFKALGSAVTPVNPKGKTLLGDYFAIVGVCHAESLNDVLKKRRSDIHHSVAFFVEGTEDLPAVAYEKSRAEQSRYWNQLAPFFEIYDVLLTPTVAVPPFRIGEREPAPMASYRGLVIDWENFDDWLPFTYPFNITGQPAATVPCGFTSEGLPIGLQIVGRRHDEMTVLRVAAAFERAMPWRDKYPPVG